MSAPVILRDVAVGGRRFVLRQSSARFPFEVSEVVGAYFTEHQAYRLEVLAEHDLEARVREVTDAVELERLRAKPVSELTMRELDKVLRAKRGPIHERQLSAADQYRAEHPLALSCMPDHHR